jgi:hypothetical protein
MLEMPATPSRDEAFWKILLTQVDEGKVIPIVGSGVVTRGDDQGLFYPWLARRLAQLMTSSEEPPPGCDLNWVAMKYLIERRGHNDIYTDIKAILDEECPAPGQSLLDLASISRFDLYLTTTFDPLLQRAIDCVRHAGDARTAVSAFSPGGGIKDLPARRRDLTCPTVFHLLGRVSSAPEYVVWEEDVLEFMLALNKQMPNMERLSRDLREHALLFIGLNFGDWPVRFFLRVSKQEPFSAPQTNRAYIADGTGDFPAKSMVIFFHAVNPDIRVHCQDPVAFCGELARRWKLKHPSGDPPPQTLPPPAPEMPRGAVFVSYAREDEAAAAGLVRGLQEQGCLVWYDRQRLQPGACWHNSLEDEVKRGCSLFLSVISKTTEATGESYYHLERNWAAARAERMAHDQEFYIPIVVDDSPLETQREPRIFRFVQVARLPGGVLTSEFAQRVLQLQRKARSMLP